MTNAFPPTISWAAYQPGFTQMQPSCTCRMYGFYSTSELFMQISELKTFYTDAVKYLPLHRPRLAIGKMFYI